VEGVLVEDVDAVGHFDGNAGRLICRFGDLRKTSSQLLRLCQYGTWYGIMSGIAHVPERGN
jgi:hypothetical protein